MSWLTALVPTNHQGQFHFVVLEQPDHIQIRILDASTGIAHGGTITHDTIPDSVKDNATSNQFIETVIGSLIGPFSNPVDGFTVSCTLSRDDDDNTWELQLLLQLGSRKQIPHNVPLDEICTTSFLENLLSTVTSSQLQLNDAKNNHHKINSLQEKLQIKLDKIAQEYQQREAQLLTSFLILLNRKKDRVKNLKSKIVELERHQESNSQSLLSNSYNSQRRSHGSDSEPDTDEEREEREKKRYGYSNGSDAEQEDNDDNDDQKSSSSSSSSSSGFTSSSRSKPTGFTQMRPGDQTQMAVNAEDLMKHIMNSDDDDDDEMMDVAPNRSRKKTKSSTTSKSKKRKSSSQNSDDEESKTKKKQNRTVSFGSSSSSSSSTSSSSTRSTKSKTKKKKPKDEALDSFLFG